MSLKGGPRRRRGRAPPISPSRAQLQRRRAGRGQPPPSPSRRRPSGPRARAGPGPSGDEFGIHVGSAPLDEQRRVLKHGDTFALFDRHGDVVPAGPHDQGLYHDGTRHLSRFELRLNGTRPLLLSSTVKRDNALLSVDLSNPDLPGDDRQPVARGTVHVLRSQFLWNGACYERLRVSNFGLEPVEVTLSLRVEADFADIFEVRGQARARKGRRLEPEALEDGLLLRYEGLDGRERRTRIECDPPPTRVSGRRIDLAARLEPKEEATLHVTVTCESGRRRRRAGPNAEAFTRAARDLRETESRRCVVVSSNEQFNEWVKRSSADLAMMLTRLPRGLFPYAGVPWYSTVFGRDGLVTGLEVLWHDPEVARGVLLVLAGLQAERLDPEREAEPGKILHESRDGEMAALGEIPFGRYYGSVDSTPLFALLAGAYWERTGDRRTAERLWPHVLRALDWVDRYGDSDGDGFVEYAPRSARGLINQGWKDSPDSVFCEDGRLAKPPIALCEVQGYVFAAKRKAALLGRALGDELTAARLEQEAEALRARFERAFWCERLGTYALALDGTKRQCRVKTSNPGHCLYTGIVSAERAARVARGLMAGDSFSGWGVRTVSELEVRYNPMSYHNGSVWPHDNALVAAGFARYGLKQEALSVFEALFEASRFVDLERLPELFCGFPRRPAQAPTLYPVACNPQAWASASVYLLLAASLGLSVDGVQGQVLLEHPMLPPFLDEARLCRLPVGGGWVELAFKRRGEGVAVDVLDRKGPVEVVTVQ